MIEFNIILYVGIALTLGFLLGKATQWLRLTAIVGYIIAGVILGPIMSVFSETTLDTSIMNITVEITLGLVGFIIGIGFTKGFLKRYGKMAITIAFIQSTVTFILVAFGIYVFTRDLSLSLILGVIGLATAPAGTVAAIHLLKGRGNLSRMTMAIVGIDDGIAIIYFVFVLAIVKVILGGELSIFEIVSLPLIEIGGGIIIGIVFGVVITSFCKLVKHREDFFIITIGFILVCIGISDVFNVSSILACMVLGVIFINMSPRIGRTTYMTIETMIPPIFVLFFAIAGLELWLQLGHVIEFGISSIIAVIIIYIIFRILGKLSGATYAGKLSNSPEKIQRYLGFALLSQAGVAIGLAILVSNEISKLPGGAHLGALVITIIPITTIIFEIIGPIGVKFALIKAKEVYQYPHKS